MVCTSTAAEFFSVKGESLMKIKNSNESRIEHVSAFYIYEQDGDLN